MSGVDDSNMDILGILDSSKPQEKHLLDNVSLMTTISPIPSQNNSLQPGGSIGSRDSEDGVKFLGKIRGKLTEAAITEERETNVSTLTAFEDQLHEHLKGTGSTSESSAHATTEVGNAKVMYGFDLSPVHSLEKKPTDTNQGNFEPEASQANSTGNIDDFFNTKRSVPSPAPNFMQAKIASPRHLRSEKSGVNEDTETVMSQVFSSQDVTTSINGERRVSMKTSHSKHGKHIHEAGSKTNVGQNIKAKVNTKRIEGGNEQNYAAHSRVPKTSNKRSSSVNKGKGISPKVTPVKRSVTAVKVVTPKSPKQRQSAIKVTPRIKSNPKAPSKRRISPSKDKQSITSKNLLQSDTRLVIDSTAFCETDLSVTDASLHLISSSPAQRRTELVPHLSAGVHTSVDEFRSRVKEVQEQLEVAKQKANDAISENDVFKNENDQLKKDNFVLKSKVEQLLAKQDSKRMDVTEKTDKSKYDENLAKLELEISEQDKLILGYQRENERIYSEMKKIKQDGKDLELAMYKENLKLKSEISKLQETIDRDGKIIESLKDRDSQARKTANTISMTDSDGALDMKKRVTFLENELRTEEGFKLKAEACLKKMTQERDDAEKQLRIHECKTEEVREKFIREHKIEIENLRSQLADARRLMLDKDDAFTIRDITNTPPSKSLLSHFQKRVHKLEADLEKRDATSNDAVKMLKEQYDSVKAKYEERINNLEQQIKSFRNNLSQDNMNSATQLKQANKALERKLADALSKLKSQSLAKDKERDVLMEKIQSLQQSKVYSSPKAHASTPFSPSALAALKKKCEAKDLEIEKLRVLLQKSFDDLATRQATSSERRGRSRSREKRKNVAQKSSYNPVVFEAEGYTSLMKQNTELKAKLEGMELELRHNKVTNEALIAKLEQETKMLKTACENGLPFQQNLHTTAPKTDENHILMLQQQIVALEQELEDSQKQVTFLENESKESSVAKIREHALQIQVQQLVGELHQMHSSSPSASTRKVAALENKIRVLEEEFRLKEESFKKALVSNSSSFMQSEISKLQEQLSNKNKELTRFRLELDSILLVLREVQSQGIKIPLPQYLQSIF